MWYNMDMNPKITREIRTALSQHPIGPIQLDDEASKEPVFVVRLGDVPDLQLKIDDCIRQNLAEADVDISGGKVAPWDSEDIKRRGQMRLRGETNDE